MLGSWGLRQLPCNLFLLYTTKLYILCPKQVPLQSGEVGVPNSFPGLAFLSFWLQGALCPCVCLYVCVFLGKRATCKRSVEVSDDISEDE